MSNNYPQNPSQRDQYGNQGNQNNQDQYGNQNNQGQQDQYGNQGNQNNQNNQGQYGNQGNQDQYGNQSNQGNQGQQDQYGSQNNQGNQGQQDQYGNQNNQNNQGQQGGALGGARQMAENQIDQAIDQYGNKIPGGSQFTKQAKEAAGGVLNNLEQEAEKRMGNMGGLFGGNQNNQNQ
ncbi:MAG: hypothetical protein H0V70_08220 [Ktedonobacteraceae bacterium]|nr:hypothetical protein [Ktedonobacteraceae bacterium]